MNFTRLLPAALIAALFCFASAMLAQDAPKGLEGEEIAKGKDYAAGTRVKSTAVGISVKVPEGLKAGLAPNGAALILKGESSYGVLFLRTGLTLDEAKTRFGAELDLTFLNENAYLERSGEPKTEGKKLTVTYSGEGLSGLAQAEIGEKGQGYAVALAGSAETVKTAMAAIASSVAWAAPQADKDINALREQLEGQRLSISSDEGSIHCDLNKDGSYSILLKAGEMEQSEKGKWSAEYGILCGTLVLASSAGEIKGVTVVVEGNEVVVDGNRWKRAPIAGGKAEEPAKDTPKVEEPAKDKPKVEEPAKDAPKLERPAEANDKGKVRKVEADPNWKTDIKEVEKLEGDEMQFNVPYVGEKRLKTDFLGVSFVLPAGMKGGSDGKTPVFGMAIEGKFGLGLLFLQTGVNNAATAVALLSEEQDLGEGVVLKPEGKAKIEGGKVTQEFRSENHCARAVILIGPSGNSLGVTFIGPKDDHERLAGYVEAIIKSAQFAKPKAEEKRADVKKNMGGKVFHIYRYKQAGSGSNSSSWETKIWYHFGSDGTFYYQYNFSGDHYVKGTDSGGNTTHTGGAWSNNNQGVQGTWRIEFNISGIVLVLKAENGEESVHQIRLEGSKVFLNGEEVSVGKSDKKE